MSLVEPPVDVPVLAVATTVHLALAALRHHRQPGVVALVSVLLISTGALPVGPTAVAAQGAAVADADSREANDAWNVWKREQDPTRRLQLAVDLVKRYPGTKAAENVTGTTFNEIQTLRLETEGWERDYAVTEPVEPRFNEPA